MRNIRNICQFEMEKLQMEKLQVVFAVLFSKSLRKQESIAKKYTKQTALILPIFHFILLWIFIGSIILLPTRIFATEANNQISSFTNKDTGYHIYIDDRADLLTTDEEDALLENMEAIMTYGNVAFVSILQNSYYDTKDYAQNYYKTYFETESGTLLLIDMQERYLWIYSDGSIYDVITTNYANTITDNVYRYASNGDYFSCANIAFSQMHSLLEGHRIAQPMKYISNALFALLLAMLFNYCFVMFFSKARKVGNRQLLENIDTKVEIKNPSIRFLQQTRKYSPRDSESSHKSGSSSRSSGGGGGHRF